ncbi:hypothetical protein PGT21_018289 [Puccinia graminis f. sp. tritici]|uniref:Uncharacterized protein n=1 Tax=Puccinia graminis f. sp. tritici TaxID=56615 RepID=A0A5B0QB61_PUCGR|nr:hypothetical protein PGT21_018289 [Puccinia graminis f. sp. tritici]
MRRPQLQLGLLTDALATGLSASPDTACRPDTAPVSASRIPILDTYHPGSGRT